MINGVLTERTVKEVIPILKTNSDGLKKTLEELVKQYKSKQDEMESWKVCCPAGAITLTTPIHMLTAFSRRSITCKSSSSRSKSGEHVHDRVTSARSL
jgi:hypothetical protein